MSRPVFERHELSAAYPDMQADEFQELKDSIENIGIQNPIVIYEGKVIDGWHRYRAAADLGIDPPSRELDAGIDPAYFVESQNGARRSMTQSQKAMAASIVWAWKNSRASSARGHDVPGDMVSPSPVTVEAVAKEKGVTARDIKRANAIIKNAVPEVQEAVKAGKIGVEKGSKISTLPKDQQAAAIDKPLPKKDKPVAAAPAAPDVPPEDDDSFAPSADELRQTELEERAARDMFDKLLAADDKLAAAMEENKRLNHELATVKIARDGYMNKCNELMSLLKSANARLDRIKRSGK